MFNPKKQNIMKTKKFLMTSLLVMGMIIAKAANGFPPELVLVSQPVLTYNANSVTLYYDVQNIGDYTYKGYVYIYLDPDDGYCYAKEWVKVCPGRIKRIAIDIPAYRPNPSWAYTVMPYYELYDELFSFTTFEYFEPLRFCWYGYHNEPWVVIRVGPRPRYYNRPGTYRYYYDGFRPPMPPPGGHHPHDLPPMDPKHHTYGYHHSNGGYPANHHPDPGHNPAPNSGNHPAPNSGNNPPAFPSGNSNATVNPHGSNTAGSMGSSSSGNSGNSGSSGATTRPSSSGNSGSSGSSGTVSRPSSSGNSGSSGRTGNTSGSSGRSGSSSSSSSSSGRSGSGSTGRR